MKIHEYQGKELLKKFGVAVPRGVFCQSADDAVKAAESLGGKVWVVKAQIHAGGRGKGGGVKVAKSLDEVRQYAGQILGMQLVTHQTGPAGQKVRRLLIEEGADIRKEYYGAALTDRTTQKVVMMASSEGGMDIEKVAHDTPEKILKVFIDPVDGMSDAQATELATGIGVPAESVASSVNMPPSLAPSRRMSLGHLSATPRTPMPSNACATATPAASDSPAGAALPGRNCQRAEKVRLPVPQESQLRPRRPRPAVWLSHASN